MSPSEIDSTMLPPQGLGRPHRDGVSAWSAEFTRIMILDERKDGLVRLVATRGDAEVSVSLDAEGRARLRELLSDGADLQPVPARPR